MEINDNKRLFKFDLNLLNCAVLCSFICKSFLIDHENMRLLTGFTNSLFRSRALCVMTSKGAFRRRHLSASENNGSCSAEHSMAHSYHARRNFEPRQKHAKCNRRKEQRAAVASEGRREGRMEKTEGRKRGDVDGAQKREIFNPIGAYI